MKHLLRLLLVSAVVLGGLELVGVAHASADVVTGSTVYGLNPVTGTVRWTRDVRPAWSVSAIGCGDLVPNIGSTSTPVVDAATHTAYFTAKVNHGPDTKHPHWTPRASGLLRNSHSNRCLFAPTIARTRTTALAMKTCSASVPGEHWKLPT